MTCFSTTCGVGAAQALIINEKITSMMGRTYNLRMGVSPLGMCEKLRTVTTCLAGFPRCAQLFGQVITPFQSGFLHLA
jgi:hypothetical protein